jgi:hypothetical protein|tara:strand:- start:46 stop:486 length:441 start_codon:yes stop_codon:yes gene_type:complete
MFADSFERLLQMQRENDLEKLKFDTLKGRKEGFDRLREGIQQIPKADMSNMQGMPSGFNTIPGMAIGNMQGLAVQGQGDLIAYPSLGSRQGGFNIMNPFTYGNMNRAVEGTRAGDQNIQYSDSPAGQVGEAANERNRLIQQLLEGS